MNMSPSGRLLAGAPTMQVPEYSLAIEGTPVPVAVSRSILSVSVAQVENQPASFSLSVNDPTMTLVDVATGLFVEGRRISIGMGYVGSVQPMIDGEVASVSVNLNESGGLTLGVDGFDGLHAGTRGTRYREFRDGQTDAAIVQEIASGLRMAAVVSDTGSRSDRRVQANVSDLSYLQRLADANDYQLWVDRSTLFFLRERPAPPVMLTRGLDLISFSARLSTAGQVSEVEVRGWDAAQKQSFSARARISQAREYLDLMSLTGKAQIDGNGGSQQVIVADGNVRTIEEAQRLADSLLARQRRRLLSADGSSLGNPDIRVGSRLVLVDLGRFSGGYVVERVQHAIGPRGYTTSFEMRQPA